MDWRRLGVARSDFPRLRLREVLADDEAQAFASPVEGTPSFRLELRGRETKVLRSGRCDTRLAGYRRSIPPCDWHALKQRFTELVFWQLVSLRRLRTMPLRAPGVPVPKGTMLANALGHGKR